MEPETTGTGGSRDQRLGVGIALGTSIGVALWIALDNILMLAVGMTLGIVLGMAQPPAGNDEADRDRPSA